MVKEIETLFFPQSQKIAHSDAEAAAGIPNQSHTLLSSVLPWAVHLEAVRAVRGRISPLRFH